MSRIKQVQDYLTEVEEYLKKTLADEKLSPAAQIKRRHLLDRFYALDLQANDNRNPLGSTVSHCKSAITINGTSFSPPHTSSGKSHGVEPGVDSKALLEPPLMEEDDSMYNLYEEPVLYSTITTVQTSPATTTTTNGPSSTYQAGNTASGKIVETVYAQEECSDTEYESFDDDEDDENSYNTKSQRSNVSYQMESSRASREVPLPLVRKNSSNDMDLLSRLPNVLYSGKLYQKGLLSWLKRFYIISDSRLLAFRSSKHFRPLLVLDLVGCDVEYVVRDNSKYRHALKISRPIAGEGMSHLGGATLASSIHSSSNMNNEVNSCWFYASEREIIDIWIHHLCLGGCVRVNDDKTPDCCLDTVTMDADSGVCDNQTNISGGSSEGGSGDGVTSVNTGLERKPSSCTIHSSSSSSSGVGASFRKKLKIGESLQSLLMGPFSSKGRQKDDRIKKAFIDAGGMEADLSHVAGYVNVSSDLSEGQGRWSKRFCVARQGRLDCYKDPLDETIEFSVPLKSCSIAEADKQLKKIVLYCDTSSGEKVEVGFEMFNLNDFGKWLVLVIRETGYRLYMDSREPIIAESVYNEVYDWPLYGPTADIQPPPLPKERPPSRVIFTTDVEGTRESHSIPPLLSDGGKSLPVIAEDNIFGEEFIDKDGSFHLEEIMASAFDNIKKTINDAAGKKQSEAFSSYSNSKTSSSGMKSTTPSSSSQSCLPSSSSSPSMVSSSKSSTVLSSSKTTTISVSVSSSTAPLLSSLYSKPATSTSSATTMTSSSRKELTNTKPFNELASRYPTLFSSATSTFISNASLPSSSTSSPATSRSKPSGMLTGGISVTRRCMVTAAEEKNNSLPNLRKCLRSSSVPPRSNAHVRIESEKINDSANNNNHDASPKKQSADLHSSSLADQKVTTSHVTASATATGLSSKRNSSFVHSSINMANMKNEINKRNSMYNYNISNNSSSNNNNIYKVCESKAEKVGGSFVTLPSKFQPQKLSATTCATNSKTGPVLITASVTAAPIHVKGTCATVVSCVTSASISSCKAGLSASTTTTTPSSIYKTSTIIVTSVAANVTAAITSAIINTASTTATAVKQPTTKSTSVSSATSATSLASVRPSATSLAAGNSIMSAVIQSTTTKLDTATKTVNGGKNVVAGNGRTIEDVKGGGTTGGVEIGRGGGTTGGVEIGRGGGLQGSDSCSSSSGSCTSISSNVNRKVKTFSPDRKNSELVNKRSSFIALSALTTSNSKLREARAEIRKSSLELKSILPSTAARQHLLLDRNLSDGAVTTTTVTTTTASVAVVKQI